MTQWMLRAYAKVNLGLRVLHRRDDGYHELDTYFLQISLADQLFFEKTGSAKLVFTCNWPEIPADQSNLCVRAYHLIAAKMGRELGLQLHLQKNVPAGGGLGGGSSDAAMTLMAINHIYRLGWSKKDLHQLALQLGSDVSFFLEGGLCRGQGRGEILSPLASLPQFWILLIVPGIAVSTASVYKNIKLGLTKSYRNSTFALLNFVPFDGCDIELLGVNDLEEVVFARHPELLAIKDKLQRAGALLANMTGSGAVVFGVFGSYEQAHQTQEEFRSEYRTIVARPIKWGYDDVDLL